MKPKLKPPGTESLKLKCDDLLSNFAFKFNMRRYIKASPTPKPKADPLHPTPVHSREVGR